MKLIVQALFSAHNAIAKCCTSSVGFLFVFFFSQTIFSLSFVQCQKATRILWGIFHLFWDHLLSSDFFFWGGGCFFVFVFIFFLISYI
jgi:hypothetical protein